MGGKPFSSVSSAADSTLCWCSLKSLLCIALTRRAQWCLSIVLSYSAQNPWKPIKHIYISAIILTTRLHHKKQWTGGGGGKQTHFCVNVFQGLKQGARAAYWALMNLIVVTGSSPRFLLHLYCCRLNCRPPVSYPSYPRAMLYGMLSMHYMHLKHK